MPLPENFKVDKGILELESKIGVGQSFFLNLLQEDDWSFVIKLHALFEAACTHLLLYHFQEPSLADVFARIELSNKTTGKVMFLSRLELLNKENRRLVAALSELRNSLVHDVRNAEFSFTEMLSEFSTEKLKGFAIAFSPFESRIRRLPYNAEMKLGYGHHMQRVATVGAVVDRLKADPKLHIWLGAYDVLVSIVDMYGYSDYKQWAKSRELFDDDLD